SPVFNVISFPYTASTWTTQLQTPSLHAALPLLAYRTAQISTAGASVNYKVMGTTISQGSNDSGLNGISTMTATLSLSTFALHGAASYYFQLLNPAGQVSGTSFATITEPVPSLFS